MCSLPGSIKVLEKDGSANIMHQSDRQTGKTTGKYRQTGWHGAVRLSIHTSLMSIQTVGSLWLQHAAHSAQRS